MRARKIRGAWWLAAVLALLPGMARAQGYAPPSWASPVPLGSTRPEEGGLFIDTTFAMYNISNPLKNQTVARSGFRVFDNSLGVPAGTFIGPADERVNVQQLRDDIAMQPGFTFGIGYKFRDGSSLELNWMYLNEIQLRSGATLDPQFGAVGADLARTFLTVDVFNEPAEYSGPPNKVNGGSPFVAFGLFNGASIVTQSFRSRFQQWELSYKYDVIDEDYWRMKAIVGPRFSWFWDKYQLRTVNYGNGVGVDPLTGVLAPVVTGGGGQDQGLFSQIVSNRMYGVHAGVQCEQYLGHGFACVTEGQAAAFMNIAKERAKFETGEKYGGLPESKFSRTENTIVPELQGSIGLMWFPWENVQIFGKVEGLIFFNTLAAPRPLAFDYLRPRVEYESTIRYLYGFQFGASIHF